LSFDLTVIANLLDSTAAGGTVFIDFFDWYFNDFSSPLNAWAVSEGQLLRVLASVD
jgi:hypothetical protein